MDVLALLSAKGGVGKTTTAVNLATQYALQGRRTLLIDLDPQGASGHLLRISGDDGVKARKFWNGRGDLEPLIKAADIPGLDVLPASDSLRKTESVLDGLDRSKRRLEELLDRLEGWERVVIDCPPGLGLVSENVVRAAQVVLVPVTPSALALRTLEPLGALARQYAGRLRPFVSMSRGESTVLTSLRQAWPQTLVTAIPLAPVVELAAHDRVPVVVGASRTRIAQAYRDLLAEVELILHPTPIAQVPP